jgi:ATP phosphoribosyltransferase
MSALVVALPSKGRLQEQTLAFFERAGLPIRQGRGERDYRGRIAGLDGIELAYLSASEIARELAAGAVHLGVTGQDLVREQIRDAGTRVRPVLPLGFGRADVVVAVPQAWIDVATMADLDDVAAAFRHRHGRRLRVATKYVRLTRAFFAEHGVGDYRIIESLGATEGAPAAGAAEAIVDITTTGRTLAANALKTLADGTILRSEAHLFASRRAGWNGAAGPLLRRVLDRIAAEARARTTRELRFAPGIELGAGAAAELGATAIGEGRLHVPEEHVFDAVDALRRAGATDIAVARLDYLFGSDGEVWPGLAADLGLAG